MELLCTDSLLTKRLTFDSRFSSHDLSLSQLLLPNCFQSDEYKFENQRALQALASYMNERMGVMRATSIFRKLGVSLATLHESGSPLTTRLVTQLSLSAKAISYLEMEAALLEIKKQGNISSLLDRETLNELRQARKLEDLSPQSFHKFHTHLTNPFQALFEIGEVESSFIETLLAILYIVYERFFCSSYDRIHRFAHLIERNQTLSEDEFYDRVSVDASMFEDIEVGTIYPAPNGPQGQPRYYRLAAKLISANGQLSLFFLPMGSDNGLPPLRVIRGTLFACTGIDNLGYFATDFEKKLGKQGYESGCVYEDDVERSLGDRKWAVVGFSAGGCMAQWYAAHTPEKVSHLYLVKSPGVPKEVLNRLNYNVRHLGRDFPVTLFDAKGDFIHFLGERRAGYRAPDNMKIRYCEIKTSGNIPHTAPPIAISKGQFEIREGFTPEEIQDRLSNRTYSYLEDLRQCLGGNIIAPLLLILRDIMRALVGSRAEEEKGLWVERIGQNGKYEIERIVKRPMPTFLPEAFSNPLFEF